MTRLSSMAAATTMHTARMMLRRRRSRCSRSALYSFTVRHCNDSPGFYAPRVMPSVTRWHRNHAIRRVTSSPVTRRNCTLSIRPVASSPVTRQHPGTVLTITGTYRFIASHTTASHTIQSIARPWLGHGMEDTRDFPSRDLSILHATELNRLNPSRDRETSAHDGRDSIQYHRMPGRLLTGWKTARIFHPVRSGGAWATPQPMLESLIT